MKLPRLAFALLFMAISVTALAGVGPRLADFYTVLPSKVVDPTYSALGVDMPQFTADLNGDGHEDLVVLGVDFSCCGNPPNVPQPGRIFFGDGDGNFTAPAPGQFPIDTLKTVTGRKVLFGDLNGDGRLDMFIACHGWDLDPYPGEQNRLYLSGPGGGWTDATATLPQLNDFSHSAALGDLSGRGVLDIIVGNFVAGQNQIGPYVLLNNGAGQFTMTRANIPAGPGQVMDSGSGHWFNGTTLADLNSDGLPELILAAGTEVLPYNKLTHTTVLWNQVGKFSDNKTEIPATSAFPTDHIDLDAQPIDFNGDGLADLVIVGTTENYDGWFVQLLQNLGNESFVDVSASHLVAGEWFGQTPGVPYAGAPWAKWVKVLDFNGDGLPDFSVEYFPSSGSLPPGLPLIYLNDGTGHFSTLKVRDFVAPGNESVLGAGHLVRTRNGYSFITVDVTESGLLLRGLLATKPFRLPSVKRVLEYYNTSLDHYFITSVPTEQLNLDNGKTPTRWTRTGYDFNAFATAGAQTSPVCRYYIPPALGDSHFFGRGAVECNATGQKNPTFVLEDPASMQMVLPVGGTCPEGTVAIYRVFDNRMDANHRYMSDRSLRDQMVAKGWIAEGDGPDRVVMCGAL